MKIIFFLILIFVLAGGFVSYLLFTKEVIAPQSIELVKEQKPDINSQPKKEEDNFANSKWEFLGTAPWEKRDAHTLIEFLGKLWVLGGVGGTSPIYRPNYNDIWSSENAKDWTLITKNAPWPKRRGHATVVFQNKIWVIGGITDNDRYLNDVWASEDGMNWQEITKNAQWSRRKGFEAVVFKDKIYILGGADEKGVVNDVWASENGKDWTLITPSASWSERYDLSVEIFDNKIWLSGGVFPDKMAESDIWSSEDGASWKPVAKEAFPGRHGHCFFSFNNELWVIAGWSGYAKGYNDVWYSKDGENWQALYQDGQSPWPGREDLTCLSFQNKIFMTSGMLSNGERTNDLWILSGNFDNIID
jgi:hypothetical protein